MQTTNISTIPLRTISLEQGLTLFLEELSGRNVSPATLVTYEASLRQWLAWLTETDGTVESPTDLTRAHISEYLAHLASRSCSGMYRARVLAAIRAYAMALVNADVLVHSPATGIVTPKKEQNRRAYLRRDEYTQLLAAAGSNPRDFCLLTLALQTGLRVSELCALSIDDVDLAERRLTVRNGKGGSFARLPLERKSRQALKRYLELRHKLPASSDALFLNRYGEPLGERGVRKLVARYAAGLDLGKTVSPHTLRHTYANAKAKAKVTVYELKELMRHRYIGTTQQYINEANFDLQTVQEATSL